MIAFDPQYKRGVRTRSHKYIRHSPYSAQTLRITQPRRAHSIRATHQARNKPHPLYFPSKPGCSMPLSLFKAERGWVISSWNLPVMRELTSVEHLALRKPARQGTYTVPQHPEVCPTCFVLFHLGRSRYAHRFGDQWNSPSKVLDD